MRGPTFAGHTASLLCALAWQRLWQERRGCIIAGITSPDDFPTLLWRDASLSPPSPRRFQSLEWASEKPGAYRLR